MEKDWELAILMNSKEYFNDACKRTKISHEMITYATRNDMTEMASYIREKLYPYSRYSHNTNYKNTKYDNDSDFNLKPTQHQPKRRSRYFDSYSDDSDAENVTDLSALYDNDIIYKPSNKRNKQIIDIAKRCVPDYHKEKKLTNWDPVDELKEMLSKKELKCDLKLLNDVIKFGAYRCVKYIIKRYKFDIDEAYMYAKNAYDSTKNEAIKPGLIKIITLLDRNEYSNCDATITLDFPAEQLESEVLTHRLGNKVDKLSLCFAVQCDNLECYIYLNDLLSNVPITTKYVYEIAKINNSEKILECLEVLEC